MSFNRITVLLIITFFLSTTTPLQSAPKKMNIDSFHELQDKYSYVDPQKKINRIPLNRALSTYDENLDRLPNKDFIVIIDYSISSRYDRFFLVDMRDGSVQSLKTSHGKGSDRNHDGYAERFSNIPDSKMSSLGYFITAETYYGKHGYSLRLDGKSFTNSLARHRAIVIHGAGYVNEHNTAKSGRSWGCPALDKRYSKRVIDRIRGGALIYSWVR